MKYEHGQMVYVTDSKGSRKSLFVWEDQGKRVFVTSKKVFEELKAGTTPLMPIGVPRADVQLTT